MPTVKSRLLLPLSLFLLLLASPLLANEDKFEGGVSATLTRAGTAATHFVFTRKGNLLRIENTDNKLEPVNIIDLEARKLTIVYPHNTTFVRVGLVAGSDAGRTPLPNPTLTLPGSSPPATTPAHVGPGITPPPGFPTPPPMPSMPQLPRNPAAGPGPPGMGMPAMPMPPMPGMMQKSELKKTEQTKKIQGYDCTLYTLSERGETFELWVTNDSSLFPFRLLERDFLARRFGPQLLEETWPQLLRDKSLFPLEATLKMEPGGQERLTFKVDKIEKKPIADTKLFQLPEKYIEIQAPQF